MVTTYNIKITCETDEAEIHYEASGSADAVPADVTKSSSLYSSEFGLSVSSAGAQISAKGFKDGMEESDAITKIIKPVTVPMKFPDGSILFYDRGEGYGKYVIGDDGYPERLDGAVDDGTASSDNWRYLICDKSDLDNDTFQWGPYGTDEGLTGTAVGYGLPNTNAMITKYADNDTYWWKLIKEKRDSTGLDWFMPSKDEFDMMYDNRTVITGQGGDAFQTDTYYWSSSEDDSHDAWSQYFSIGLMPPFLNKSTLLHCRLIRRI